MPQMFAWRKRDGNSCRNFEPEHMLGILRCPRWIAMLPPREDLEYVRKVPIAHAAVCARIDSRFLGELAHRGMLQRFADLDAPRHRLPMVDIIGALDQQYFELWRVNDDEDGNGSLVMHLLSRCHSEVNALPSEEPASSSSLAVLGMTNGMTVGKGAYATNTQNPA